MRRPIAWIVGVVLILLAAGAAFLFAHNKGGEADDGGDVKGQAFVTLAPVRRGPVEDVVQTTGQVQADPAGAVAVTAPRAVVVLKVFVRPGEAVKTGQPLIEVADAPASALAYAQARHAQDYAERDLERVRRMAGEHLASNDQLSAAEKTLADARSALAAATAQGAGRARQTLTAPVAAVVATVPVSPGDRVAEAADLVTLSGSAAGVAKLWLAPSDASKVSAGDLVRLDPVFGGQGLSARLRSVGRQVDATTKMLDAVAPVGAVWPVGASVKGEVVTGVHDGLTVPRASVVFDETGAHVFVVAGGQAKRVDVSVGRDIADALEVRGALQPGAAVVVEGAYQLEDGMAVRTRAQ
jgi:RND family efflux transporter MFP subunit